MGAPNRLSVAKRLANIGLKKTLIAVHKDGRYEVSRIKAIDQNVNVERLGAFSTNDAPVIGRVGIPDPQLGVEWHDHMPFYGKWFDEIGETDAGYHLRRGIASISPQRLLEQIKRDNQYALVGEHSPVFRTIVEVKRRIPLVLIDDRYVPLTSFPVILPHIADEALFDKLTTVLHIMLKSGTGENTAPPLSDTAGIEVDEVDG